jgi:hypothetical protein
MKAKWPERIRKLLREKSDGLTVNYIAEELYADPKSINTALRRSMPDAYIDRWTDAGQQQPHQAVWCIVVPPENCPKPTRRKT